MANICDYKIKVKGKKNACYAFFGSMPCYGDKWIESESGTLDDYTIVIKGDCKWGVNCYARHWDGEYPVHIPEDPQAACQEGEDKYWYYFLIDKSQMFNVEIWCNSIGEDEDIDIYEELEYLDSLSGDEADIPEPLHIPGLFCYEHYLNGNEVDDVVNAPEEIIMTNDFCDFD